MLNEINEASEDILSALHVIAGDYLTESESLPDSEGTTLQIHPHFRIFGSFNGVLDEIKPAVLDRFPVLINVATPNSSQYARLDADVAKICRDKYENADPIIGPDVTYRQCLAFTNHRRALPSDSLAAALTFGEREKCVAFLEALAMTKIAKGR